MFGLKIITKKEYQRLLDTKDAYQDLKLDFDQWKAEGLTLKKEIAQLKKELEKLDCMPRTDRPSASETVEPETPLVEGHKVICNMSRPCDGCELETPNCKKLYTGNGTICVEPEGESKDVIDFK